MSLQFLPATTYVPQAPKQASGRVANTLIKERPSPQMSANKEAEAMAQSTSRLFSYFKDLDSQQVVSPLGDDIPTPRPLHLLKPAPSSMVSDDDSVSPVEEERDNNAHRLYFDDMYDVSDDEINREEPLEIDVIQPDTENAPPVIIRRPSTRSAHNPIRHDSLGTTAPKNRYPSLTIPRGDRWPTFHEKKSSSPIPPTPPPKIPISPAVLSLLSQDAPNSTAPPSLDGSLTSDQLANSSAPPTPSLQTSNEGDSEWSGAIQLHPDALATLHVLPGNDGDSLDGHQYPEEQVLELDNTVPEMEQLPNFNLRRRSAMRIPPAVRRSLAGLTQVDIPSPTSFFSSLNSPFRNTWCPPSAVPPSSSTAEQFYKAPWNMPLDNAVENTAELTKELSSHSPVEQFVEVKDDESDGPPTARPTEAQKAAGEKAALEKLEAQENEIAKEHTSTPNIGRDFDDKYHREIRQSAALNLDRTSQWLATQSSYLAALKDLKEEMHSKMDEDVIPEKEELAEPTEPETESLHESILSPGKKSVRFSQDLEQQSEINDKTAATKKESAFYRAFQKFSGESKVADAFVHRQPRFDAIQAQRICQPVAHTWQLSSYYQLKRRSVSEDATPEEKQEARALKESDAMDQMNVAMWSVMASKVLNQGKLLISPAAKRLAQAGKAPKAGTVSKKDRARVLDLGGQPVCDWAWHCARNFPNAKIYTVFTKNYKQIVDPTSIRGPHNHRSVSVPKLSKLPFDDNYFDVISARSLYMMLKANKTTGAGLDFDDEYDMCLKECYRCLKPGGFLEFSLMDAEIVNAGPLGSAMSVEFGFNLKTRGYDPNPTRMWLSRLKKAGFGTTKRAWIFLPMGAPLIKPTVPSKRDSEGETKAYGDTGEGQEPEVMGSTAQAASITGMVGSWAWEKWMLKLHVEAGQTDIQALNGVSAVLEEGRKVGAGWRSLSGWARKPVDKKN